MERRQRRSFTDDYKRQAVDLVASSGRSVGSVAKELGLRDSVLRRWVERRGAGREPTAASRRPTVNRRSNLTPYRRPILTPLGDGFWRGGRVIVGSTLEAPAVVSGLDDIAVVGQSIEQRGGHFGVTEDARPFTEGEGCGDDDRGALVEAVD